MRDKSTFWPARQCRSRSRPTFEPTFHIDTQAGSELVCSTAASSLHSGASGKPVSFWGSRASRLQPFLFVRPPPRSATGTLPSIGHCEAVLRGPALPCPIGAFQRLAGHGLGGSARPESRPSRFA